MPLTTKEIALVRECFERLASDLDTYSADFYDAFFSHAPELRGMFRDDLTGQGMKFMSTLRNIIRHVHDADQFAQTFSELGKGHASLGVRAENFAPMEEALVETLRGALAEDFSAEHEAAWRHAFADIASEMIKAGRIE